MPLIFFCKKNTLIVQKGWKWANSIKFIDNEYHIDTELPKSTEEWEKLGYKSITKQEAKEMVLNHADYIDFELEMPFFIEE